MSRREILFRKFDEVEVPAIVELWNQVITALVVAEAAHEKLRDIMLTATLKEQEIHQYFGFNFIKAKFDLFLERMTDYARKYKGGIGGLFIKEEEITDGR